MLDLIVRLRDEGKGVVVISHAMDHVIEVADRAVVLRRGRKVGELVSFRGHPSRHGVADRGRCSLKLA